MRIYSNQWDDSAIVEDEFMSEAKKIKGFKKYFSVERSDTHGVFVDVVESLREFWSVELILDNVRDDGCKLDVHWNSSFGLGKSGKSVEKFCKQAEEISRVFDEVSKLAKIYSKEINEIRGF